MVIILILLFLLLGILPYYVAYKLYKNAKTSNERIAVIVCLVVYVIGTGLIYANSMKKSDEETAAIQ